MRQEYFTVDSGVYTRVGDGEDEKRPLDFGVDILRPVSATNAIVAKFNQFS